MIHSRALKCGLILPLWLATPALESHPGTDGGEPVRPSGLEEQVLVRRVRLPIRIDPRRPGGCDTLAPSHVRVLEDGVPAAVDAVEPTRLDTLHALLIDTSYSMRDRLRRAKRAAAEYLRSLPGDEPVLLASFSDSLVLHAPPTTDRAALEGALETMQLGVFTALNDALHAVIRYLAPRPERKVLVVVTDGCDSASLRTHPFSAVVRLAEETSGLTVFPIGIDLRGLCEALTIATGPRTGPGNLLESLGRRSGGAWFHVRETTGLPGIFHDIRARLEREGHLIYEPPSAPRTRAARERPRRRRIEVRSLLRTCNVELATSAVRLDGAEAPRDEEIAPLGLAFGVRVGLPAEGRGPGRVDAAPYLHLDPGAVRGRAVDILTDRGGLYAPNRSRRTDRYRLLPDLFEELGPREFTLEVPPFERLEARLASPEDLMRQLLELGLRPFGAAASRGRPELGPAWIHGQTFLSLREHLGRALYSYPGYGEWARRRLLAEHERETENLIEELRRSRGLPESAVRALREALRARRFEPGVTDPQRYLAEWLGDLPARDLILGLERAAAQELLMPTDAAAPARGWAELVEAHWSELGEWFPPPTAVRVITPLVPCLDRRRGAVGFYRVVLPEVRVDGPPARALPDAPLGLRLVRWLGEAAGTERPALAPVVVQRVEYGEGRRLARGRSVRELGGRAVARRLRESWSVTLHLGRDAEAAPAARLTGLFLPGAAPEAAGPWCVVLESDPSVEPRAALEAIRSAVAASGLGCPGAGG